MPGPEVEGVGSFNVPDGKRLVLATKEDAGVDVPHRAAVLTPGAPMRRLPAGSEPASGESNRAYRAGWMDGRYGGIESMAHNDRLAEWKEWRDRLDYYRGHRAGREACPVKDEQFPKAS